MYKKSFSKILEYFDKVFAQSKHDLLEIKKLTSKEIVNIDDFGVDGDYIESQAFAYLGIRSFLKKKISFPQTTKVSQSITGGELVKNY